VPIVATLDSNGAFSIALPATDDPDISPSGFTYKVEERFGGKLMRSYDIMIPYDTVGTSTSPQLLRSSPWPLRSSSSRSPAGR
jgi:hypothetical protein